jgi:plasmid stability protein
MATLHVRNVPDELYELLRERATTNGRSIGAEAVVLLQSELGTTIRPWRTMFSRRRHAPTPFHRFTPRARSLVGEAKDEARDLGDSAIGTEHLLLVLLRSSEAIALFTAESAGLDYEQARAAVEGLPRERADVPLEGSLPFTPGAKKAMELALRYCIERGSGQIGPEELLLGIAREDEGFGARILVEAGLDVATLGRGLAVAPRAVPPAGFRVVELAGTADDWERQLNSLADQGYELVEIVAGRAIFRVPMQEL